MYKIYRIVFQKQGERSIGVESAPPALFKQDFDIHLYHLRCIYNVADIRHSTL